MGHGKHERDFLGAIGILGGLLGEDNPVIAEAARQVRAKAGIPDDGDSSPAPAPAPAPPGAPKSEPKTAWSSDAKEAPTKKEQTGRLFACVFDAAGLFTGEAYASAGQAFDRCPEGGSVHRLGASNIPETGQPLLKSRGAP